MTTKPIPELRAALQRFVDKHFDNAGKERPRISIPANPERDDDLVLSSALDELEALRVQSAQYRLLLVEALQQCSEIMPWVLREELRAALRAAGKAPEPAESAPPRWRVGRTLGRTLYRDDRVVGLVDTPELAAEIVAAVNMGTSSKLACERCGRLEAALRRARAFAHESGAPADRRRGDVPDARLSKRVRKGAPERPARILGNMCAQRRTS